jgi:hypothetical protein
MPASHQRDDGLQHGLVNLLKVSSSYTSSPATCTTLSSVPLHRPVSCTSSPAGCTAAASVLLSHGYPSGLENPAGGGYGGVLDPVAGMGAGGGDGEKGRRRVWGCRTRPQTRRVPSGAAGEPRVPESVQVQCAESLVGTAVGETGHDGTLTDKLSE